jgi:hypothetical protein
VLIVVLVAVLVVLRGRRRAKPGEDERLPERDEVAV